MENNRKVVLVIGGLSLALVAGSVCVCGLSALVNATLESEDQAIPNARSGAALGAQSTLEDCIRAGHDRTAECGDLDITCMAGAEAYFGGCMDAVAEPDLSICAGAPPTPAFFPNPSYMRTTCARFGWAVQEVGCTDVISWLETWCAIHAP